MPFHTECIYYFTVHAYTVVPDITGVLPLLPYKETCYVNSNSIIILFLGGGGEGIRYDSRQKYYAPQVEPDPGSNSWPPDHDRAFHVIETWPSVTSAFHDTETPGLTTWPSVTILLPFCHSTGEFNHISYRCIYITLYISTISPGILPI